MSQGISPKILISLAPAPVRRIKDIAQRFEPPLALDDSAVFDLSKTKFADPKFSVRKNMFMNAETIKKICDLLPVREGVDLGDTNNTGVIELATHRVYKSRKYDILSKGSLAAQHSAALAKGQRNEPISEGPVPRFREGTAHGPLQKIGEAKTRRELEISRAAITKRRGRGRPPKEKSDAVLTHRFQVMLSQEDIARVRRVQELAGVESMSEAIRLAVVNELERLEIMHKHTGS
jgi:hypothetical protein